VASSLRTTLNEDQFELDVRPLRQHLAGSTSRLAWAALAAGGLIALICAANLGNLGAARGLFRSQELATRKALGATPVDFAWMLLTEIALTKVVACVLGLAIAAVVLGLLARLMPIEFVTLGRPAVTWRVFLVAVMAGLFLMLASLGPAALAWRYAIRKSGTQVPDGRQVRVLRFCLGAGQATLAVILLVAATFLIRSEANLFGLDSGFTGDVHAVKVSYPASLTPPRLQEDVGRTLEAFARIPGVSRTAAAWGALVDKTVIPGYLTIGGRLVSVSPKFVTRDYFSSLGSRLVSGHLTIAPGTAVINEALARSHFVDRSPLGHLIGSQHPVEIVGIIADELDWALDQPPNPTVYYALANLSSCGPGCDINYVLRLAATRHDVDGIVAFAARSTNRDAVVVEQSRLRDRLTTSVADRTFATTVVTLFACAGVSVVTVGLFAMVSFIVARRTREIAIRAAIGAAPRRLLWAAVHETVWMCAVGIPLGAVLGAGVSHMIEHQLFGVPPRDPVLLATASAAMLVVALVAALVPGWRALRIEPSVALRSE
jgi:predicted permease